MSRAPEGLLRGHLALVFVQFCYGLFPFFVKETLVAFQPFAMVGWRIAFGALVLGGLAWIRHKGRVAVAPADWPRLLLCAFLGVIFNQAFVIEGIARTTSVHAGLITTLIPVYTFALAVMVGQEGFTRGRALGIAIAGVGAALLVLTGTEPEGGGSATWVGDLLIAANCLSYSLFLIVSRPLLERYPAGLFIGWVYVFALVALPFCAWRAPLLPADPSRGALLGLGYVLLFPTVLAYLFNTYALARVSASTTAVYIYLQPLIAGAVGVWVLDETFGWSAFGASLLLGGGLGLTLWFRPPPRAGSGASPSPRP